MAVSRFGRHGGRGAQRLRFRGRRQGGRAEFFGTFEIRRNSHVRLSDQPSVRLPLGRRVRVLLGGRVALTPFQADPAKVPRTKSRAEALARSSR